MTPGLVRANRPKRAPRLRRTTTRAWQKLALILSGIIISLLLTEGVLRIGGLVMSLQQNQQKSIGVNDSGRYRILCLGESTTAGDAASWPSLLEGILNSGLGGERFRVYNEGRGGTNTAYIVQSAEANIRKYRPDMIIVMMGINDASLRVKYDGSPAARVSLWMDSLRLKKLLGWIQAGLAEKSFMRASARTGSGHLDNYSPGIEAGFNSQLSAYNAVSRGYGDVPAILLRSGYSYRPAYSVPDQNITRYNFRRLYEIAESNGVALVIMQYPLRDIGTPKSFFSGSEKIIYVENKENFLAALRTYAVQQLFTDMFAGDFGHTNANGSRLIAENVAEAARRAERQANLPSA